MWEKYQSAKTTNTQENAYILQQEDPESKIILKDSNYSLPSKINEFNYTVGHPKDLIISHKRSNAVHTTAATETSGNTDTIVITQCQIIKQASVTDTHNDCVVITSNEKINFKELC